MLDQTDLTGDLGNGLEIVKGIKNASALILMCSEVSLASRDVKQEIQLAWKHDTPILPLMLEQMLFPDDVSYWLEGAQWIEVLDKPGSEWFDGFRRALALTGFPIPLMDLEDSPVVKQEDDHFPPNNLPQRSAAMVGRDRELKQLLAFLENNRLVTVTGPGGTGKTRLAEAAARAIAPRFPDGIWFVDGAEAHSASEFGESIASTLGVPEAPDMSLTESIVAHLGEKQALLLLDNLEHLSGIDETLTNLLSAPSIAMLATSRRAIGLTAEVVFPLSPFAAPSRSSGDSAVELARNPAVAMFVARAIEVRPDFRLTDGNARDIAAICEKLDGLPLAIELAAARIRMLNPGALLDRLMDDFRYSTAD